ncbi:hypothetical protein [Streptomyces sp. NPDC101150]|uniref:hypothetical protein n=1 Tax=Streptomyces sp. NPDC101150 TaxID=3366114 RepID=UPI0037FCABC9
MLKHYYRLVYWKRRIAWALGLRSGGRGAGLRAHPRASGRGAGRGRQFVYHARPLLVFGALVAIVVTLSALIAWVDDPLG